MNGPASVGEVQLLCGSATNNAGTFYNYELRACHTALVDLTVTYDANYGGNTPVTVASASPLELNWTNGEWGSLVFDTPFDYNGTDNLLLEFRWQGDDGRAVYALGWYPPGGNRVLDGYSLTNPTGTLRSYMNRLRIHFTTGVEETEPLPVGDRTTLRCFPNPCPGRPSVAVELTEPADARLRVFDRAGALVRTLHRGRLAAGPTRFAWDRTDDSGDPVPPGIYLCRLEAAGRVLSRPVTITD